MLTHSCGEMSACFTHITSISLHNRRLEVVGTRKMGARERDTPCVSPSRAPVLSLARYFQAPATQAKQALQLAHENL